MNEIWKDIKGWEGIYQVSNTGLVKRLEVLTSNNIRMPEQIKTPEIVDGGYLRVQLIKRPRKERFMLHRLVADHFIPNPENKPQINHKDCNKNNNNASNLEWVTERENMIHSRNNVYIPRRSATPPELVMEIFESPHSLRLLSRMYSLPKLLIQSIKSGKRHSKITGKLYYGKQH